MRVLLVNAHGADDSRGGAERYVAELARRLPAKGFEISLVAAFPGRSDLVPATVLHDTDWTESRARRIRNHLGSVSARPTQRLAEVVAAAAPDVLHSHNLPGITTGVWEVARRAGVPVVHCLHDYYLLCPRVTLMREDGPPCLPHPLLCGARARRLARWAGAVSHVHGPSEHVIGRHSALFDGTPATVIRHPRTQRPGRALTGPRQPLRSIGFIGALDRTKGVHVLLDALPTLECELLIAGDGNLRGLVEDAARRHENLTFLGPVAGAAKDDFFERCDLGVVPSVWEEPAGPPFALLEWLGSGRPVVASTRGGLAEVSGELSGTVACEPTVSGLVEAIAALRRPEAWASTLAGLQPPGDAADDERWVEEHARVLRSVAA